MFDILYYPLKAIASAKKEKSIGKTILILFITSLLASLNVFIITKKFSGTNFIVAFGIIVGVILLALFMALLLLLTLNILSQKQSTYFDALTTLTYGFFIWACGYTISSLINLIPHSSLLSTLIIKILIGLILLITFILAVTVKLRAAMEFFQANLFTVILALMIIYTAIFLTIYLMIIKILFANIFGMSKGLGALGMLTDPRIMMPKNPDMSPVSSANEMSTQDLTTCNKNNLVPCQTSSDCINAGGRWCENRYTTGERIVETRYYCAYECHTCTKDAPVYCGTKSECDNIGAKWCERGYTNQEGKYIVERYYCSEFCRT